MKLHQLIKARDQLMIHEGYRQYPYKDSKGILTVGFGRNLEQNPITEAEAVHLFGKIPKQNLNFIISQKGLNNIQARYLLKNDILKAYKDLLAIFGNIIETWTDDRVVALLDMAFNLGRNRLLGFRRMIEAVKLNDWDRAADEAVDSKWARDVGPNRYLKIFKMLKEG